MITKSTLQHLRIPFSFFLMPVFWFALSVSKNVDITHAIMAFIVLHLFIYPASNGFNSYYDKDEGSIGGLEKPPPVSSDLLYTSLLFDAIGIMMGLFISWQFALALFIYGLISKAYSYDGIRLKKYPIISLLACAIFQGGFIFLAVYQAVNRVSFSEITTLPIAGAALLNTVMLAGSYPMTQIYQHEEDARRGDLTMSRLLGIRGTFIYTAVVFMAVNVGFAYYYYFYYNLQAALLFQLALLPVFVFFLNWFRKVYYHPIHANFKNTMWLNLLSASCLNIYFIVFFIIVHFL